MRKSSLITVSQKLIDCPSHAEAKLFTSKYEGLQQSWPENSVTSLSPGQAKSESHLCYRVFGGPGCSPSQVRLFVFQVVDIEES